MKKIYLAYTFFIAGFCSALAQVGIGTTAVASSAALQIEAIGAARGFNFPQVDLVSSTSFAPFSSAPTEGMVVFSPTVNIITGVDGVVIEDLVPGYYFWDGGKWVILSKYNEEFIVHQEIDINVLGYDPQGSVEDVKGGLYPYPVLDIGNNTTIRYKKERCVNWIVDKVSGLPGYGYCAFTIEEVRKSGALVAGSPGTHWEEAFNFAKAMGGYLVTIPQRTEWNFILNNVIKPASGSDEGPHRDPQDSRIELTDNIWIGYNKITTKGNTTRFKWITGEQWSIDWEQSGTTGANVQHNFTDGEPNNVNDQEGCTHIWFVDHPQYKNREWNDGECNYRQQPGYGVTKQIIVKFRR